MKKWLTIILATVALSLVATPAFATYVSPVTTQKAVMEKGAVIHLRNYTKPKLEAFGNRSMWYYIDQKTKDGKWIFVTKVEATLYNSSDFKGETRAKKDITAGKGNYRLRARLNWVDGDGDEHLWRSAHSYFAVSGTTVKTPTMVSKVGLEKTTFKTAKDDSIMMRNYIKPKYDNIPDGMHMVYMLDHKVNGAYVHFANYTALIYNTAQYAYSTRAKKEVQIADLPVGENESQDFRVRAKLVWTDGSDLKVKKTAWTYFKVKD